MLLQPISSAKTIPMIPDLLIVGGGVIGLSLADCALRRGLRVTLLDKSLFGQESSWAGAGMLTCRPRAKVRPEVTDNHDLTLLSIRLHAQWAQRLQSETGIDVGYRVCGAIELIMMEEAFASRPEFKIEAIDITARVSGCMSRGVRARQISAKEAHHLEPSLGNGIAQAIEFPDEAQIRNPRFLRALIASVKARGGILREGEEVLDIDVDWPEKRIRGITLAGGQISSAGAVVICAGAWSGRFPSLVKALPICARIEPVRGQLLCYQSSPPLATRLLTNGRHYCVPRDDGVLLVGATHEHVGFVKNTTLEGLAELQYFAHQLLPALKSIEPIRTWAGLRPGLKRHHPIFGAVHEIKGLFVASGHYRNGLTLAPATAELVVQIILGENPTISVKSWMPND